MPFVAQAAYLRDVPVTLTQPDGTTVSCFFTGDEYFRYAHDARGFVILQDPVDGRYVYAETGGEEWRPGPWTVGTIDPASLGLQPHPPVPAAYPRARWELMHRFRSKDVRRGPFNGTLQNAVVFLRFNGETEFADAPGLYDQIFNEQGTTANSMSHYYQEVSQGQLDIRTTFYPLPGATVQSFESDQPRGYYQPRSPTNPGGYSPANGQRGHRGLPATARALPGGGAERRRPGPRVARPRPQRRRLRRQYLLHRQGACGQLERRPLGA
jgi:hypothetical protein